jgi:hypothetical protein
MINGLIYIGQRLAFSEALISPFILQFSPIKKLFQEI